MDEQTLRKDKGDRVKGTETGDKRQETGDRRQETGDRRQEEGENTRMRSLITVILASSTEYAYICKMPTSSRQESHKDTVTTTRTTTTTIID